MLILRCWRKVTQAQTSPGHSESWLSACLWGRVGSRSGLGICHVTQAGVARHSSTTAQLTRQSVTLLCASPKPKEGKRVCYVTEQTVAQPQAEDSSKQEPGLPVVGQLYSIPLFSTPIRSFPTSMSAQRTTVLTGLARGLGEIRQSA